MYLTKEKMNRALAATDELARAIGADQNRFSENPFQHGRGRDVREQLLQLRARVGWIEDYLGQAHLPAKETLSEIHSADRMSVLIAEETVTRRIIKKARMHG